MAQIERGQYPAGAGADGLGRFAADACSEHFARADRGPGDPGCRSALTYRTVNADPELLSLALRQIIDNAFEILSARIADRDFR